MTTYVGARTRSPLEAAKAAWHLANLRERHHANACLKLARNVRCDTCLDLEAAQNRAADLVERLRQG